ncbi:MAG: DUF3310 domain-containing protein [Leuconostoc mesenteroides]
MSEIIYVRVGNLKEFEDVVVNNGVKIDDFYIHAKMNYGNQTVVRLSNTEWAYCSVGYFIDDGVDLENILSYKEYMKKYGHTDWTPDPEYDAINPSHYTQFDRETIDTMKGMSTPEEFRGHLKLTAVKYISRYQGKNGIQDIEKAIWYMERLKKELIDEQSNTTN